MTAMPPELRGLKVLVVEDNFLIAELIRSLLDECGCETIGPAPRVSMALDLVDGRHLDGAFLDINLAGEYCFAVAEQLRAQGVPFVFLTGYDDSEIIPPVFREVPRITKPFDNRNVASIAARLFCH